MVIPILILISCVNFTCFLRQCTEGLMREKICEMVSVMRKAATVDDESADQEQEKVTQLLTENRGLKEMLRIHRQLGVSLHGEIVTHHQSVQTGEQHTDSNAVVADEIMPSSTEGDAENSNDDEDITPESSDIDDSALDDLDNTVIEIVPPNDQS